MFKALGLVGANARGFAGAFLCMLTFLCGLSFSQEQPERVYPTIRSAPKDSLETVLLSRLSRGKLLILGDAAHRRGFYLRTVTDLLEAWIGQLRASETPAQPRRLFLFLEVDQAEQLTIEKYFATGDDSEYLAFKLDQALTWGGVEEWTTTDQVEFIQDLRGILEEIKELNRRRPELGAELRVIGCEATPPYHITDAKDYEKFMKARLEWFANERDSLSAAKISRLMDENPDFKGIVFIGQGHIESRTLVDKANFAPGTSAPPTFGYFMPHYVDRHFGRENVTTVSFFYHRRDNLTEYFDVFSVADTTPDIYVYSVSRPPMAWSVYLLRSRKILSTFLATIRAHAPAGANEGELRLASATARGLIYQLKRSYLNLDPLQRQWIDSLANNRREMIKSRTAADRVITIAAQLCRDFDSMKDIDLFEHSRIVPGVADSSRFGVALKMWFANLLSDAATTETIPSLSLAPPNFQIVPDTLAQMELLKHHKDLTQSLLINLLWIATPEESSRAVERLRGETGLNLATAKEWAVWWRGSHWVRFSPWPRKYGSF